MRKALMNGINIEILELIMKTEAWIGYGCKREMPYNRSLSRSYSMESLLGRGGGQGNFPRGSDIREEFTCLGDVALQHGRESLGKRTLKENSAVWTIF